MDDPLTVVLLFLVSVAAVTDVVWRRIPNAITLTGAVAGLAGNAWLSGVPGLTVAVTGIAAGIGLFIVFYWLGGMGAGDVKLLGAVGAVGGPGFVLLVFVFTGLAGGAGALIHAAWRSRLGVTLKQTAALVSAPGRLRGSTAELAASPHALRLPYGVFIAIGTAAALAARI